jgi:glucose/arabinose dehydrogenase
MAHHRNTRRSTAGLAFRASAGVLAVALGSTLLACSAPAKSSSSPTSVATTPTTAVDTGTGPTSITMSLRAAEVASGFTNATNIASRPMRNQLWVTQRSGAVRAIEIQTAWNLELGQTQRKGFKTYPGAVIDISSDVSTEGERGLLGIAFSTDARTLFLSYVNKNSEIVIASWAVNDPTPPPTTLPAPAAPAPTVPGAPPTSTTVAPSTSSTSTTLPLLPAPVVDRASKRTLLTIAHEGSTNYAGHLMLGRDGFLYIGVGDSPNGATEKTAQNPESLLGKILRIDPAGATTTDPYAIPPGNPFASGGGAPQIWSLGVQNPLRFSFDRSNGNMWVADAGRAQFGEIDYLPVSAGAGDGANLGWPYTDGKEVGPATDQPPSSVVTPIGVTPNAGPDCPIIGGYVYRGSVTEMQGVYIYGDFCTGSVKGLLQRKGIVLDDKAIGPQLGSNSIVAFAEDNQGELYVVTAGGSVQRLVAA